MQNSAFRKSFLLKTVIEKQDTFLIGTNSSLHQIGGEKTATVEISLFHRIVDLLAYGDFVI